MMVYVKVKPNSSKEGIEKVGEFEYFVSLKEKAVSGKANKRLIVLLSKEFGVGYRNIKIKNPSSRRKIVEIIEDRKI